jgi:hypothetical protein
MRVSVETNNIEWQTAKGWLKDGERQLLFELASQLPGNAAILNLGVEFGASLACLRAGNPTATIYGVDLDITKAVSDYRCLLIQEDSHQLVREWTKPLDLIFVDGDHGEEGVFLDGGFADFLPIGAYILFQDCFDYDNPTIIHQVCPGVMAGVNGWFAQPHIQQEFEEWPSVDTTRVFKRIRERQEHEQSTAVAGGSGPDTDFQPGGITQSQPPPFGGKPEIRGRGENPGRRR